MELIAHRGAGPSPENTLPAFEQALALGADGVELDVRCCGSGEVVVAHDPHLGRLSGLAAQIARTPLDWLSRIDLGKGARLATLDDALDLVLTAGRRVNVEVKGDVPDRLRLARAVVACLARRRWADRDAIWLSTFDPGLFLALRAFRPRVPLAFLFDGVHTGRARARLAAQLLRPDGLHPHQFLCTPDTMSRYQRFGFVYAWTVNDPERARQLAGMGVTGLISDDITRVRRALSSKV